MGLIVQQYYNPTSLSKRVRRYNGFSVSTINTLAINYSYSDDGVTKADNGDICHRYSYPQMGYMRVYVGFTTTVRTSFATTPQISGGDLGNYDGNLVRISDGVGYRHSGFTSTISATFTLSGGVPCDMAVWSGGVSSFDSYDYRLRRHSGFSNTVLYSFYLTVRTYGFCDDLSGNLVTARVVDNGDFYNSFYDKHSGYSNTIATTIMDEDTYPMALWYDDYEVAEPPVAYNFDLEVIIDTNQSGMLQAADANGDPLTYSIVSQPSKGLVVIDNASTGAFTFYPGDGESGSDYFTFRAWDGSAYSNTATVSISIIDGRYNSYGFKVKSTIDASVLLGSDDSPYIFAGKAPVVAYGNYAYVLCNGAEYNIVNNGSFDNYCAYIDPEVGSVADVIALVQLTSSRCVTYLSTYSTGFQFSTNGGYPTYAYLFYKSASFNPSSDTYGLKLFDGYGNPVFDTGMGKLLNISEVAQITGSIGATATLSKSYTKPGVMFSSCYCRSTRGALANVTNPCGTFLLSLFTSYGLYLQWDGSSQLSVVERAVITNYLSESSYYNWYPYNVENNTDGRSLFVPVVELANYD